MNTYIHVVDTRGNHWLLAPDKKSLFNGVNWARKESSSVIKEELGEVTIEDFLLIIKSN
jgi:hypothetical protein